MNAEDHDEKGLQRLEESLVSKPEQRSMEIKIYTIGGTIAAALIAFAALAGERYAESRLEDDTIEKSSYQIERKVASVDDEFLLDESSGQYAKREGTTCLYDGNQDRTWSISQPDTAMSDITRKYGLPPNLLHAMMIASSHYNPHIQEAPPGYKGAILLDPVRAGVTSDNLESDHELSLESAALLYKNIRQRCGSDVMAVSIFFAGEDAVRDAIEKEKKDVEHIENAAVMYERIRYMPVINEEFEERERQLNWIENIENAWQRSAIYMTLRLMDDEKELSKFMSDV